MLFIPAQIKAGDTKKEAKRYFEEYKSQYHARKFDAARRKLETAIALAPDEPLYLYELAKLQGSRVPPYKPPARGEEYYTVKRFMNLFEMFKESIEIYDRVAKRFPNYPKILYSPDRVQTKMCGVVTNMKSSKGQAFTVKQRQYIRRVMKDYRRKAYPQMRKHYWKFDLDDGINSHKEYTYLFHYYERPSRFYFFCDYEEQMQYAYELTVKFVESTQDYLKKHPELLKMKQPGCSYAFWKPESSNPEAWRAWKELLRNDDKLVKGALKHPNPKIRQYGEALAIYQAVYRGKENREKIAEKINAFVDKYPEKGFLMTSLAGKDTHNSKIFSNYPKKNIKKVKLKRVLKHLDVSGKTRGTMNKYLIHLVAADNFGRHIYILMIDRRQSSRIYNKDMNVALKIYDYDMKTGQWHVIWKLDKYLYKHLLPKSKWKFHALKEHLLFSRKDQIFLIAKDGSYSRIIQDLPVDEIRDLTILGNRIYVFLSRTGASGGSYALDTMLMSCDLKGNDRKIHISTMRRNSKNFFDRQKPFLVSGLFADPERKRLLFSAEKPIGGLWEFHPDTGSYKQLIKQSRNYGSSSWGRKCGNKLYLRFGIRGKYYVYDLAGDKAKYIFFDEWDKCAKHEKNKAEFHKYINVGSQFIITDDRVWFADRWRVKYFERKKPICLCQLYLRDIKTDTNIFPDIDSRFIRYPLSEADIIPFPLYPHPDGKTMVLVTSEYIFALE